MKKMFLFAVAFVALSAAFQSFYALVHYIKGESVEVYPRFLEKEVGGNTKFNALGLLSPVATESQRVISDTFKFTEKVIYPVAPKFQIVSLSDTMAEVYVANKISKAINDTINKIKIQLGFDYDRQAMEVRNAMNPNTVKLQQPKVELSMFGTSSPEAVKYGMKTSLQPEHLETENADLASERLKRTGALLKRNLSQLKIDSVKVLSEKSQELQLKDTNEVNAVIKNPTLLDSMRYVKADVSIPFQRLEVTPVTSPIALPLWLVSLAGLAILLNSIRRKREGRAIKNRKPFPWNWFWKIFQFFGIISVIIMGMVLLQKIPSDIIIILIIIASIIVALAYLAFIIYALWNSRMDDWRNLWREIWRAIFAFFRAISQFFKGLFWMIILLIVGIILLVWQLWDDFRAWWGRRCDCCKILMVLLGLHIIYDILHFGFHIL